MSVKQMSPRCPCLQEWAAAWIWSWLPIGWPVQPARTWTHPWSTTSILCSELELFPFLTSAILNPPLALFSWTQSSQVPQPCFLAGLRLAPSVLHDFPWHNFPPPQHPCASSVTSPLAAAPREGCPPLECTLSLSGVPEVSACRASQAGWERVLELATAGTMGLLFLAWLSWQSLSCSLSQLGFGLKLPFQD